MSEEILRCRCGKEVRIIRLGHERLGLAHVHEPKNRHRVHLERPAVERLAELADVEPEDFNVEGAPEFNGSFR